jgi:hypothetical protein
MTAAMDCGYSEYSRMVLEGDSEGSRRALLSESLQGRYRACQGYSEYPHRVLRVLTGVLGVLT